MSPTTDIPVNDGRERAIFRRDKHRCQNCLRSDSQVKLQAHRIVPPGAAGSSRLNNYVTLCERCHEAAHMGHD
jgi:5-methylcytosine-specific restriction endonuclease McrA